mgnify:CR=1 FL=1
MPFDVAEVQLVVFVFCTAGGQNHGVFRQCLCKIRVIAAALCTAVTSSHDNEFFDRAGFHGIDDLVCQGEYLCMGEAPTMVPCSSSVGGAQCFACSMSREKSFVSPMTPSMCGHPG